MRQRNVRICAYHRHRRQGMKVRLDQRVRKLGRYSGRRLCQWCADIAQDSRVDAIREANITKVGVSSDPVVVDRLIRLELNVPSALKYAQRTNLIKLTTNEYRWAAKIWMLSTASG